MRLPWLYAALVWLGFAHLHHDHDRAHPHGDSDGQSHEGPHGHTHGVIDPAIATSQRGIWAVKWSFVILAVTAALQFAVVIASDSIALLADTIHNVGDAATAVPLWIAFRLASRKPSARFTYGLGRLEDLAGVAIVGIILLSAIVAGWEAMNRLIYPHPIIHIWAVAVAGVIGFAGNEACAIFRIRVGGEIDSAALIADGYHARTDGLTSLAVVVGAVGVWLGFPLADPIVGLLITIAILGIVWQSAKAVFTRLLDGVEPHVVGDIRHAAGHVAEAPEVLGVRARWLGHRLMAELDVAMDGRASIEQAEAVSLKIEHELFAHMPGLSAAIVRMHARRTTIAEPSSGHRTCRVHPG